MYGASNVLVFVYMCDIFSAFRQDAKEAISETFWYYHRARLRSALKHIPPDEFLASWEATHEWGTKVCLKLYRNRS